MEPICRFLLSCAILAIAIAPLILYSAVLVTSHPHPRYGWWIGVLLGGAAEWYRLVENCRRAGVDRRLLPGSRTRAAFLDRSMLHWRH